MNGLEKLRAELVSEFLEDLVPFWTEFAIDDKKGGFLGRVTWNKQKVYDAEKGGILNARLLWAFSAAYKQFKLPELEAAAQRAYNYFVSHFLDQQWGGVFWMLNSEGQVKEDRKHVYAQAFGIYGLTEYYSAFQAEEALHYAKELYSLIEEHAADNEHGGYLESYTRQWELNESPLSEKDENAPKSMNTHLHILEAYTNFYRYAPDENLEKKLRSLIQLFRTYVISKDGTHLVKFMDKDWKPTSDAVSYGHDIEASWLLMEAAEVLGDEELIQSTKKDAVLLAEAVLTYGLCEEGGVFNEADLQGITDSDKDWWAQAEAIVGFINAFEVSGNSGFLDAALVTWEFKKKYMKDKEYGEWHEKVSRNGTPFQMDKVRSWKGPYHTFRLILEVNSRVKRLTKAASDVVLEENSGQKLQTHNP